MAEQGWVPGQRHAAQNLRDQLATSVPRIHPRFCPIPAHQVPERRAAPSLLHFRQVHPARTPIFGRLEAQDAAAQKAATSSSQLCGWWLQASASVAQSAAKDGDVGSTEVAAVMSCAVGRRLQRCTVLRVRAGAGEWRGPWQRRRESVRILARSAEGRGRSTGPVARPDSTLLSVLPFMDNSVCDGGHIHSEVSSQPSSRS